MSKKSRLSVAGFFAGAGGLDLGFKRAGFEVPYANEFDKTIWSTYQSNFPKTALDKRSIVDINPNDVPPVTGYVGGPPCQSWSEAGAARGIQDKRGQLFFDYLQLIDANRPSFFVAENVSGILFERHAKAFRRILQGFLRLGYNVSYGLIRASDFEVPQDRDRVFIIGYRTDLGLIFQPPKPSEFRPTLRHSIWDLQTDALPIEGNKTHGETNRVPNHEYMIGGFSTMYMSRNRVRSWDETSFTIQAGGRHAPLHPQAPKMTYVERDRFEFKQGYEHLYRRLSVREAARIQTFPDDFVFNYSRVTDGYKMIGNAVPVKLAEIFATVIKQDMLSVEHSENKHLAEGDLLLFEEILQPSLLSAMSFTA